MRNAKAAYDTIRWDPRLDPRTFTIRYEDRLSGLVEVPFDAFAPGGDVPWHRVRAFCRGDLVVWDRAERIDRLATMTWSGLPDLP
jgi:poly(A) polymerase